MEGFFKKKEKKIFTKSKKKRHSSLVHITYTSFSVAGNKDRVIYD